MVVRMKKEEHFFDNDAHLNIVFCIAIILFAGLSFFKVFYSDGLFVDTLEHIRASYFIENGLLPYKDFFEHHNPLLWFMLAPLTKIFKRNLIIVDVVRTLSVVGYGVCIYLMYVINAKFLYGKKVAKYSTLLLLAVPVWHDIANIRPDIFMMICFLVALYLFYSYREKKNSMKLIVCYTLLSVSFLFLQKVLFLIAGFGVVNLWMLYKKEIRIKDFIAACVIGSVPLVLFGIYLLYEGIFADWFYYNFTFNTLMQKYYGHFQAVGISVRVLFIASLIIIFKQYANDEKALPVFVLTLFSGLSLFWFFPHPQYSIPYFLLASVYFGKFCEDIKIFEHKGLFILGMAFLLIAVLSSYPQRNEIKGHQYSMKTMAYINQIEKDKSIVPVTIMQYPIFTMPAHFYWFGYLSVAIVDVLYTPGKYFDFDAFLKEKRPDYIVYSIKMYGVILPERAILYHRDWFMKRNVIIFNKMKEHPELGSRLISIDADFWKIDEAWIKENYEQIKGTDVYKRKD